nr:ribonuclease H-like domain-containing protein [Tanacetum cinerariifolium]
MNKWLILSLSSNTIKLEKCASKYGSNGKIVDSWANQHMTYTNKELDNILDISHLRTKVGHPNGTEAYISKIGNLKLSNGLTLSSFVSGSNNNTADADSSDDFVATQNKEVAILKENVFSASNLYQNPSSSHGVQNVKRSSIQSVFLRNYNDFVVESKVKYDIEKYEIVELPEGRKAIGSKWIYKIKFKSNGEIDRYKPRLISQAPREWNANLTSTLIENGFSQSKSDTFYVVHYLSQFMHSPLSSHLKTAFKILRYLKSCLGLGIHIAWTSGMFVNAHSDTDWANCIITRKIVTG